MIIAPRHGPGRQAGITHGLPRAHLHIFPPVRNCLPAAFVRRLKQVASTAFALTFKPSCFSLSLALPLYSQGVSRDPALFLAEHGSLDKFSIKIFLIVDGNPPACPCFYCEKYTIVKLSNSDFETREISVLPT